MSDLDKIPFNTWSRERIAQGKKICTSRHKRYSKDKRVYWISPMVPWRIIRTYFFDAEGANSSAELQNVIEKIYKREVPDEERFYVHFGNFKRVLVKKKMSKVGCV